VTGGDDGEGGSSGEEWIMRGDLTKKKRKIVFGDGSDFRQPGWEEELIDFKRKLRMPQKLIQVAKPSSLTMSPTQSAASSIIGEKGSTTTSNATSSVATSGAVVVPVIPNTPTTPGSHPTASSKDEPSPAKSAKENKIPSGTKGGKRNTEKSPGKEKPSLHNDASCPPANLEREGGSNKKIKGRPPKSANMNSTAGDDDGPPLLEPMLPVKTTKTKGTPEKTKSSKGKGKGSLGGVLSTEKKSDTSESPLDDPTIEKAVERMKAAAKRDRAAQAQQQAGSAVISTGSGGVLSQPSLPNTPNKSETLSESKGKTPGGGGTPGGKISGGKKGSNKSLNSEEDLPLPSPLGTNSSPLASSIPANSPSAAAAASTPPPTTKKGFRRNKFKSGFDYIRKKKKIATNPDGSIAPPPPKRVKVGSSHTLYAFLSLLS